jgi:uncharacterized membrane protein
VGNQYVREHQEGGGMGKKNNRHDLLHNMESWQNKQFTPWSYVSDGNLLPHIEAAGNPKRVAIIWFAQSVLSIVIGIIVVVGLSTTTHESYWEGQLNPERHYRFEFSFQNSWPPMLLLGVISLISMLLGIVYWRKHTKLRQRRKRIAMLKQRKKRKKRMP